jgi:hypothetical protein
MFRVRGSGFRLMAAYFLLLALLNWSQDGVVLETSIISGFIFIRPLIHIFCYLTSEPLNVEPLNQVMDIERRMR